MRRAEWWARPWRLAGIVLVLVVLPLVALGELVVADSRARLVEAERRATSGAATRAAELVATRIAALADQAFGIARSGELAAAVDTLDRGQVERLLATYRSAVGDDIERMIVASRFGCASSIPGDCAGGVQGFVEARFPLSGEFPPIIDYLPTGGASFSWTRTIRVVTHAAQPPGVAFSEGTRAKATARGFIAEVPLTRTAEWLVPLLSAARELHVVDERGRVIATADGDGATVTLRKVEDPLTLTTASSDLVAKASVKDLGWTAVAIRDPSAIVASDDAAGVQRAFRLGVLALLLAAAFVIGSVAAQLQRERQGLQVANVQLDAASEAKSRFIAAVSHDLRTPLNAILGFSDVLLQKLFGELNPKQEEYLRDIRSAGEHQLALVNDLLDLSKIEAGRMELHPVAFSLPEALGQAAAIVAELASAKRLTVALDLARAPATVEHDPARFRQVVLNLLSNAIKFTPEGGRITIAAATDDSRFSVAVSDTGVGIAPEDQPRVFDEFQQVGASARSAQGTGLGLALVRGFVRMMGGEVSLRSEPGVGSTFTVRLPITQSTG